MFMSRRLTGGSLLANPKANLTHLVVRLVLETAKLSPIKIDFGLKPNKHNLNLLI